MIATHVSITLLCIAVSTCSLAVHLYQRNQRQRRIQLPDDDSEDELDEATRLSGGLSSDELEALSHLTTLKLDGKPINEAGYERYVRWSRMANIAFSLVAVVVLGIQLNLHARHAAHGRWPVIRWSDVLHDDACWPILAIALLWLDVLWAAMDGMRGIRGGAHWSAVARSAYLCTALVGVLTTLLVIPDAVAIREIPWYGAQLALSLIVLVVTSNIPSGPLHEKTTASGAKVSMAPMGRKGRTVFSRIWYISSMSILLKARSQGFVQESDAPLLGSDFDARLLYIAFKRQYSRHGAQDERTKDDGKQSFSSIRECWPILRALVVSNKSLIVADIVLSLISGFAWYVPAYVSYRIINFLEESESGDEPLTGIQRLRFGLPFCLLLVAGIMLQTILMCQVFSLCSMWISNTIKAQLQMAILTKALRRKDINAPDESKEKAGDDEGKKDDRDEKDAAASPGKVQVMNLVSVDTERVANVVYLTMLFMSPVELVVGGFLSIYLLGWGAIVGLMASLAIQPINYILGKLMVRFQERLQTTRDRKTSILNEVIQAVRMVKFNAWERKATDRILRARGEELRYQRLTYLAELAQETSMLISPALVVLIAYAWFVFVEHKPLTPSIAFTSLAVLEEMRFALVYFPDAITSFIQTLVSLRRIHQYLQSDEVDVPKRSAIPPPTQADVALYKATVQWPRSSKESEESTAAAESAFELVDLSIRFAPNALNVVVGRLGSGKSLLLKGLLGEADVPSGLLTCPRSLPDSICIGLELTEATWMRADQVAYVPQTAWLTNASVRNNVLFGLPMLEDRYEATLDACGLRPDLKILEDGDETEIGENGVGLSGGQSIRVMLARAVYGRANTLLLDDPLSAVDAHTASHIHGQLLRGPLCANRTVIMVTHQVQLVAQSAAQVIMLQDGRVAFKGDPLAFMQSDLYSGLIEEQEHEDEQPKAESNLPSSSEPSTGANTPATTAPPSPQLTATKDAVEDTKKKSPRKLVEDEKRAKGAVLMSIYRRYLDAAGGPSTGLFISVVMIAAYTFEIVISRWLQGWTDDVLRSQSPHALPMKHSDAWWITGWSMLWVVQIGLQFFHHLIMMLASLRASRVLYEDMLKSVLHAPLRFHDTVSRGRLLNRFNYDFGEMDSELLNWVEHTGHFFVQTFVTVGTVSSGGGTPFLAFFILTLPLYGAVFKNYILPVRDLKRLTSTARSPILNTFGDVARGTVVIRAFGASQHFIDELAAHVNNYVTFAFWNMEVRWWFEMCFNSISSLVMLCAAVLLLLNTSIGAAQAGFVFNFLIRINASMLFLIKSVTNLEQKLVSVERIVEYCELPGEEGGKESTTASDDQVTPVPAQWPEQGQVMVTDLHVRYAADLPDVLKGLSFSIPARAKVGVVGPTGCGKSTLASSFFRFVTLTQGSIAIDGVNIANVGLQELRSRLQIVPQDPTIFSGPVRASLDVFDEHTDAEVLDALRKVHLVGSAGTVDGAELPPSADHAGKRRDFSDLSFSVAAGGVNLSNGEKQLLCLARAILRRCKLIIFDEATSSVDFDTDALISTTIRDAFIDSTIITIAHRLRTIIDYDYVLVMDKGAVAEFASPRELLKDTNSRFFKLCRATGKRELAFLKKAAGLA